MIPVSCVILVMFHVNIVLQCYFQGKYCHLRGTHLKTCTSLGYIYTVILPVLTAMFDHLAACEYGSDLLRMYLLPNTLVIRRILFFLCDTYIFF